MELTEIWHFAEAVLTRWYALVTGTVLVLDQMLQWVWPKGKEWLDARWMPKRRRPLEIAALIVLLIASSFEAYREEADKAASTQKALDRAATQIRQLQTDLQQARRVPVSPVPPPKIVYRSLPSSSATSVGPLTASDLPILYAIAVPITGSPYLHGQVYADTTRKTVSWAISVSAKNLPMALMNTQKPENDQGTLAFSSKVDGGMIGGGRAANLVLNPKSIEQFEHSGAKFHIKLRADNGQEFEQDLPIKMLLH